MVCTGLVYRSNAQEEGLYSGLETSEYSDYASPVTEELPLSPLSQRSCDTCEELQEDSGRSWLTSHTVIPTPPFGRVTKLVTSLLRLHWPGDEVRFLLRRYKSVALGISEAGCWTQWCWTQWGQFGRTSANIVVGTDIY